MNWIKQNPFLSALLGFVIVGVVGLGYLFFQAKGKFSEATAAYESALSEKESLEKKKPYPSEENSLKFQSMVSSYKAKAGDLSRKMLAYQAPLPVGVSPANFQESLAQQVDSVVSAAEMSGVKLGDGFFLGMEDYRATPPLGDAAQRLQFQLDATSKLVNTLLENDATMVNIARQRLDWEKATKKSAAKKKPKRGKRGAKVAPAANVPLTSEVYPMEVIFAVPSANFQNVINSLSNTAGSLGAEGDAALQAGEEYFYSIRWVRVENESPEAPSKGEFEAPEEEDEDENGENDVFAPSANNLNMIFGAEKIKAYLALDLVRLMAPEDN